MDQFKSPEEMANYQKARANGEIKPDVKNETLVVNHFVIVNNYIKIVNSSNLDPFIKKVMTLRMMAPVITGKPRSTMSIAIELGSTVEEVEAAEEIGVDIVTQFLEKVSSQEYIDKFNKDEQCREIVEKAANNMGKSLN